jgi:hypothetical protein
MFDHDRRDSLSKSSCESLKIQEWSENGVYRRWWDSRSSPDYAKSWRCSRSLTRSGECAEDTCEERSDENGRVDDFFEEDADFFSHRDSFKGIVPRRRRFSAEGKLFLARQSDSLYGDACCSIDVTFHRMNRAIDPGHLKPLPARSNVDQNWEKRATETLVSGLLNFQRLAATFW